MPRRKGKWDPRKTYQDWRERRRQSKSAVTKAAQRWAAWFFVPVLIVFVWLGQARSWSSAYLVLIGSMPPAQAKDEPVAFLVSVAGYLVLPVVIGAVVAGFFTKTVDGFYVRHPEQVARVASEAWGTGPAAQAGTDGAGGAPTGLPAPSDTRPASS